MLLWQVLRRRKPLIITDPSQVTPTIACVHILSRYEESEVSLLSILMTAQDAKSMSGGTALGNTSFQVQSISLSGRLMWRLRGVSATSGATKGKKPEAGPIRTSDNFSEREFVMLLGQLLRRRKPHVRLHAPRMSAIQLLAYITQMQTVCIALAL